MSERLSELVIRIQNAIGTTGYGKIHKFSQAYASQCKANGKGCIDSTIRLIRAIQDAADVEGTLSQEDCEILLVEVLNTIAAPARRITIPKPKNYTLSDKRDTLIHIENILRKSTGMVQSILQGMDANSEEGNKFSRQEICEIKKMGERVMEAILAFHYTLDTKE